MMKIIFTLLILFTIVNCLEFKNPQGDPSEFAMFATPTAEESAQSSTAAYIDIDLAVTNTGLYWKGSFYCDSEEKLSLTFLSPLYNNWDVAVIAPGKSIVEINKVAKVVEGEFGVDGASYKSFSFSFDKPTLGTWSIVITSESVAEFKQLKGIQANPNIPSGLLIVGNTSPYKAVAQLTTLETIQGDQIGYEIRLVDQKYDNETLSKKIGSPVNVQMTAEMDITEPDGQELAIEMHDDGLEGDRVANDGIFFAALKVTEQGLYQASLKIEGKDPKGNQFQRSVETIFNVVVDSLNVVGGAYSVFDKEHQVFDIFLRIDQQALMLDQSQDKNYKVFAQVWGKNAAGEFVPVAWVSGIEELFLKNGNFVLGKLELNQRWIEKAGVKSGLELRNLRVSDIDWSVVIETASVVPIDMESQFVDFLPSLKDTISQRDAPLDVFTVSMRDGWRTEEYIKENPLNSTLAPCPLSLVHGYCAQENPFPIKDFTNAKQFTGALKQSISNNEFAKRIASFIANDACSVCIGHSQGGAAIVHTFNYYITPLDKSPTNFRLLQSVGTPFQGTALAGSLATMGGIFGVGCGSANDLTYDGARSWLSGIGNARSRLYYYYTQYGKSGLIHSCNTAANLVLSWPNDGTTENAYAPLPNGNNQGLTVGECHTSGMNYPEQTKIASRNKAMNTFAH